MTPIYGTKPLNPRLFPITLQLRSTLKKNYFSPELVSHESFECAHHVLEAVDDNYKQQSSDDCADFSEVSGGIWAFSERSWNYLSELKKFGCRVAENVDVIKGSKRFRLVYPSTTLDILDLEHSQVSWNGNAPSWVTNEHFYACEGRIPPMFQVLYNNRNGALVNGSAFGLSGKAYFSQRFVEVCGTSNFRGPDFYEIPRTKRL